MQKPNEKLSDSADDCCDMQFRLASDLFAGGDIAMLKATLVGIYPHSLAARIKAARWSIPNHERIPDYIIIRDRDNRIPNVEGRRKPGQRPTQAKFDMFWREAAAFVFNHGLPEDPSILERHIEEWQHKNWEYAPHEGIRERISLVYARLGNRRTPRASLVVNIDAPKIGRPAKYDWDIFWIEVLDFIQKDNLPENGAKLQKHMVKWCSGTWKDAPADSVIREKLSLIYRHPNCRSNGRA